jgi:hypothetical protein
MAIGFSTVASNTGVEIINTIANKMFDIMFGFNDESKIINFF